MCVYYGRTYGRGRPCSASLCVRHPRCYFAPGYVTQALSTTN